MLLKQQGKNLLLIPSAFVEQQFDLCGDFEETLVWSPAPFAPSCNGAQMPLRPFAPLESRIERASHNLRTIVINPLSLLTCINLSSTIN